MSSPIHHRLVQVGHQQQVGEQEELGEDDEGQTAQEPERDEPDGARRGVLVLLDEDVADEPPHGQEGQAHDEGGDGGVVGVPPLVQVAGEDGVGEDIQGRERARRHHPHGTGEEQSQFGGLLAVGHEVAVVDVKPHQPDGDHPRVGAGGGGDELGRERAVRGVAHGLVVVGSVSKQK